MLLLYWSILNNKILLFLKLSSCSFSNSFSFSKYLTCFFKSSNFSKNEGSGSFFFFYFISFQVSIFCLLISKAFFGVPFSATHFCNLVACSSRFSKFFQSSCLSSFFFRFQTNIKDFSSIKFFICFWYLFFLFFLFFLTQF